MSLLYSNEFKEETTIENNYGFACLFSNCSNVLNAKDLSLPATTLTDFCYSRMFDNCTSLITAPKELPATTLAACCYYGMFDGCTSLTIVPELLATTLVSGCYRYMFYGCANLNYIKAMFTTTPSDDYTMLWVDGVAATGTFVRNNTAQWYVIGTNGIPEGWEVVPPETRIVAKFDVTDTSSATNIMHDGSILQFSEIEIDGVVQPSVVSSYTFNTTGEHIVKYILVD